MNFKSIKVFIKTKNNDEISFMLARSKYRLGDLQIHSDKLKNINVMMN